MCVCVCVCVCVCASVFALFSDPTETEGGDRKILDICRKGYSLQWVKKSALQRQFLFPLKFFFFFFFVCVCVRPCLLCFYSHFN